MTKEIKIALLASFDHPDITATTAKFHFGRVFAEPATTFSTANFRF